MCATPAFAAPYLSLSGGVGFPNDAKLSNTNGTANTSSPFVYKTGIPFGGAVGYASDCYRIEAAVTLQTNKSKSIGGTAFVDDTTDIKTVSYMANGYYDICMDDSNLSPYLTAGIGLASVKIRMVAVDLADQSKFAWQVGAGLGVKVSDQVVVDLGYRYFKTADVTSKAGDWKATVGSSNILAGVRYNF